LDMRISCEDETSAALRHFVPLAGAGGQSEILMPMRGRFALRLGRGA
jgi:hypothetical protein